MSIESIRLSIFLSFVSICILIIGLIDEWHKWDPSEGLALIILGLISGIPGFFVICTLYKAWKAPPLSIKRKQLLNNLPI